MLRNVPAPIAVKDLEHAESAIHEKAQGIVEFALILPVLLLLVWGVIEVGRMLFIYSAVHTASREAARYGSAIGADGPNGPRYRDCSGMREAATRLGSLAGITAPDVLINYDTGPATASTSICPPGTSTAPAYAVDGGVTRIVVEVKSDYKPIVPLVRLPDFTITSRSVRTIIKDIKIGGIVSATEPPPTEPPVVSMHNGDMDGSRTNRPTKWEATAIITVHDNNHQPLAGATVTGSWSHGNPVDNTCVTQSDGTCSLNAKNIDNSINDVSFTVDNVTKSPITYAAAENHDPEADSNGTVITISRIGP